MPNIKNVHFEDTKGITLTSNKNIQKQVHLKCFYWLNALRGGVLDLVEGCDIH